MYNHENKTLWIAQAGEPLCLIPKMANRHGIIAGATGTGKTVTLKVLAESFSDMGVPVFLADIKGDLSGLCAPGKPSDAIAQRAAAMGIADFTYKAYPTCFYDVFGQKGLPVRTTISDMGPELLSRLLDLNPTQTGIMTMIFKIADDQGLLLLDLKDLRAMVQYVGDHRADFGTDYGNIAPQSLGAIQRALLTLETQGGDVFFGEPMLDIADWMRTDADGRGVINILDCVALYLQPMLYATFMLWMLSELYENLPEAGDLDKPKMVFFFDEAHLLFDDAPKALLQKIEQVVRLIRSKGVGIYFVTQAPADIPDDILGQLGNKIQHALRAYTPKDQKALKAAAQSFRPNPDLDTEQVLGELGIGEALISVLDDQGVPGVVQRGTILPPQSFMGPVDDAARQQLIDASPLKAKYSQTLDRESAYENLTARATQESAQAEQAQAAKAQAEQEKAEAKARAEQQKAEAKAQADREKAAAQAAKAQAQATRAAAPRGRQKKSEVEKMVDSAVNTFGREIGKSLVRGLFGSLKR